MPNLPFTMTECWENYEIGRKYWIFLATKTAIKTSTSICFNNLYRY